MSLDDSIADTGTDGGIVTLNCFAVFELKNQRELCPLLDSKVARLGTVSCD